MSKSLENNHKLVEGILYNSSCQDLIKMMRKIRNASLPAPACLRLTTRNISRKLSHQKLVLTLRRPRYSYYKQVLVSPYIKLMLSPRGCPLEKKGYEVHVLSQEHSGDVCNNCHTLEPQWFQYSPKILDSKISENNTMVKNTKMLENYLVSDTKKNRKLVLVPKYPKMVEYMCN